jgi:MurNAc alpha-1-phosphate uridylyltransferase
MDQLGRIAFRDPREVAPFVFASIQILHPRLFEGAPAPGSDGVAFPIHPLWRRASEAGRLYGLRHDGEWYHVATPEGLAAARAALDATAGAESP